MLHLASAWTSLGIDNYSITQLSLAAMLGISVALYIITRFRSEFLLLSTAAALFLAALR